ncbi:MAG TPA: 2-oxo-tetronate isomerase [Casimicrobiaceae bacterium]|nr:2-oxo-tetronate isomerase [Casimicrobiaceae bacterium]
MPRFAANLSMMYAEAAFMERFAAAERDGFKAVEYLFPYAFAADALAGQLQAHSLQQVLFNAPPGDWDAGERGLACLPGRDAEFQDSIGRALEYAQALRCPRVHVMAGLLPETSTREALYPVYVERLRFAAKEAAKHSIDVLIEPINTRDIPRYFLNRQDHAHEIVGAVGAPNLKVQMDLYHCQIVEGDLAMKLRRYVPTGKVGHMQIAGVPERHEPDVGEVNYAYLFDVIDALGYEGWIGCEYRPQRGTTPGATSSGLGWAERYLQR